MIGLLLRISFMINSSFCFVWETEMFLSGEVWWWSASFVQKVVLNPEYVNYHLMKAAIMHFFRSSQWMFSLVFSRDGEIVSKQLAVVTNFDCPCYALCSPAGPLLPALNKNYTMQCFLLKNVYSYSNNPPSHPLFSTLSVRWRAVFKHTLPPTYISLVFCCVRDIFGCYWF